MRASAATGILAIWADCAPADRAEFETWYFGEHLLERLSIPGFRRGWRYVSLDNPCRVMTVYETDTPAVLSSKAYLDRVADPTPLTRRVMTELIENVSRTVCRRTDCINAIRGGFVVTARFSGALPPLPAVPGSQNLRRERWQSFEEDEQEISDEESLRGPDAKITGCLLADVATESEARIVLEDWHLRFGEAAIIEAYRFLCLLDRSEQRARPSSCGARDQEPETGQQ